MVSVSKKVLVWARERTLYTPEQVAKKAGIALKSLKQMEDGEKDPSDRQLDKLARLYGCPLMAFFLAEPPPESETEKDFRTHIHKDISLDERRNLRRLIVQIESRQLLVKALRSEDEDDDPSAVKLVGAYHRKSAGSVEDAANFITQTLDFDLATYRKSTDKTAFSYLRDKVQAKGVFVILSGDCGNYRSAVSANAFRGICLPDPIAPFIVINKNDAKSSYAFTLLHELVHLVLNQTYLSGELSLKANKIEKFCGDVAAKILLPDTDLADLSSIPTEDDEECAGAIEERGKRLKVSSTMLAYQMLRLKLLTNSAYKKIASIFQRKWQEHKAKLKGSHGGPDPNRMIPNYLGGPLLSLTKRGLDAGYIVPTQAAQIMGVGSASRVYKVLSL